MEERRGARVATTFLVAIEDIDQAPKQRQGDISLTGVYFETNEEVGAPGTVHWLQLVSVDHARRVRVMACVVRSATRGRLRGSAFEFMPESDDSVTALENFVKYALGLRMASAALPYIAPRLEAQAAPNEATNLAQRALVGKLSVRSMVLETSWAVEPGESLRVEIAAPGMPHRIRLEGTAVRVGPGTGAGYTIEVEVHEETDKPLAHSSMSFAKVDPAAAVAPPQVAPTPIPSAPMSVEDVTDDSLRSLDDLLSSLIAPPADGRRRKRSYHLAGQLQSIPLTTLASLFEMERMTGELAVRTNGDKARVFVDAGRIVDVSPLGSAKTARDRIRGILAWRTGSFEFDVRTTIDRADRIGTTTTALLLDLAREEDEQDRDSSG